MPEECGCCHRMTEIVGVASTMTAYSIAWCRECLNMSAQPIEIIEYFVYSNGGYEGCHEWVKEINIFKDGKYVKAIEGFNPTQEEIKKWNDDLAKEFNNA